MLQGDILFMRMSKDPIRVGDILLFTVDSLIQLHIRCSILFITICSVISKGNNINNFEGYLCSYLFGHRDTKFQ
ncbi:hypothetical protein Hanom_Chr07g00618371 [Helianthus anomalus]